MPLPTQGSPKPSLRVLSVFLILTASCIPRSFHDARNASEPSLATSLDARADQERAAGRVSWVDAQGFNPLRSREGLDGARPETVVASRRARVAWADRALLLRDFPFLRDELGLAVKANSSTGATAAAAAAVTREGWSADDISALDGWLLSQVAYVSMRQIQQNVVNTAIPVLPLETYETVDLFDPAWREVDNRNQKRNSDAITALRAKFVGDVLPPAANATGTGTDLLVDVKTREALRPINYGRALVYEVKDAAGVPRGLIDAKGSGVLWRDTPSLRDHGNGLATLGEAIRELTVQRMLARLLHRERSRGGESGAPLATVALYAVVDLGFDVKLSRDGRVFRAGLVVRQAHDRFRARDQVTAPLPAREAVIGFLCKYGVVGWLGKGNVDENLQATPSGALYDYGTVGIEKSEALGARGCGPRGEADGPTVAFDAWGYANEADPAADRPWRYGHDAADSFAAHGDQGLVEDHLRTMLAGVPE